MTRKPSDSQDHPDPDHSHDLKQEVISSTRILSFAMAITIPLGFIPKILIPKMLGAEQAGVFYFGETFPLLFLSIITLGIPGFIEKYVPTSPKLARRIFLTAFAVCSLAALIMLAATGMTLYATGYSLTVISVTMLLATAQVFIILCTNLIQPLLIFTSHVRTSALFNIFGKVIVALSLGVAIFLTKQLEVLATIVLISQLLLLVLMLRKLKQLQLIGQPFSGRITRLIVGGSFLYLLIAVVAQINLGVVTFFLTKLASFEELGLYSAGVRLYSVFLLMIPLIGQALSPHLAKALEIGEREYCRLFAFALRVILAATFPLSMLFTAFGREIALLLFGNEYEASSLTIATFGPAIPIVYLCMLAGIHLFRTEHARTSLLVVSMGLVVNIIGDLLLIPIGVELLGRGGGGAACALVTIIVMSFETIMFLRLSRIHVVTRADIAKLAACVSPSLVLCAFYFDWSHLDLSTRIAVFVTFIPVYMLLTRLVSITDLRRMWGFAQQKSTQMFSRAR